MVRRCTVDDEEKLLDFLGHEAVYHTFLLADIRNYGFEQKFQTVYADLAGDEVKNVYLKFYGNLIAAGRETALDEEFIRVLTKDWKPDVVMGKAALVERIGELLPGYEMTTKNLYLLENGELLTGKSSMSDGMILRKGVPGDEDRIHDFLMTIPEIRSLYASKEMIADRLRSGDGTHLYLEKAGELIAHLNSTARSPYTVMLGGAAVRPKDRGHNLEAKLVSFLCREILAEGKRPCLFCDRGEEHNLFVQSGFKKAGVWGTLTPEKGR